MLSPCLFIVLLAIGYFFIDKKTQTELINKCKKNKFMILGGIVFIYYFFLRNAVEGFTATGAEIPMEVLTAFGLKFCHGGKPEKISLEKVLREHNVSEDIISDIMKTEGNNCAEKFRTSNMLEKLREFLRYEVEKGSGREINHMANFDVTGDSGGTSVVSLTIGDHLPDTFKYNYEKDIDPTLEAPETNEDRTQRIANLGIQCNNDIKAGMTMKNSDSCRQLANFQ